MKGIEAKLQYFIGNQKKTGGWGGGGGVAPIHKMNVVYSSSLPAIFLLSRQQNLAWSTWLSLQTYSILVATNIDVLVNL